jgi:hypothetical protein
VETADPNPAAGSAFGVLLITASTAEVEALSLGTPTAASRPRSSHAPRGEGYAAPVAGTVFVIVVGVGLMALLFHSS